jgi:hypothetical protein
LEGTLQQSRRLEGQFDHGGETRQYPTVHVLVERSIAPMDPSLPKILKEIVVFQRHDGRNPYHMHIRAFPPADTNADGTDRIRMTVRDTATHFMLLPCVKDAIENKIPKDAAARAPIATRPRPEDLVVIVTPDLDSPLDADVAEFARRAHAHRALRIGVKEGSFVEAA